MELTSVSVWRYVHLDYHTLLFYNTSVIYSLVSSPSDGHPFSVIIHHLMHTVNTVYCVKNNFIIYDVCPKLYIIFMQKLIRKKTITFTYGTR